MFTFWQNLSNHSKTYDEVKRVLQKSPESSFRWCMLHIVFGEGRGGLEIAWGADSSHPVIGNQSYRALD